MFLKSLSLRGFKSFADPTTLEFEPGVTVVVGPNGSGKSNVVDAVAWVLGAQGPRVVRSSRMDDVIFAGTAKRPPLGRAEVALTIDNSARRLPIDFSEVTVSRTLFRTGESEYAINGVACRLLDVQELFADTGVGRQQHVIIGQGQLDTILQARPEDRRMVIEEAAGVLKFRRRRERAERRLQSSEADLQRLGDLLREVRRQLTPLERQASAARRHGDLVAELSALRLHLAGRELGELAARAERAETARTAGALEEAALLAELRRLDQTVTDTEDALGAGRADEAVALLARADQLAERARGLAKVCAARQRGVAAELAASVDADVVSSLEAEAARLDVELEQSDGAAQALGPELEMLAIDEARLADDEAALAARLADEPDAGGEAAGALRARCARAREALARTREAIAGLVERIASLERRQVELGTTSAATGQARAELATAIAAAGPLSAGLAERSASCAAEMAVADESFDAAVRAHAHCQARREALERSGAEAAERRQAWRLGEVAGVLGALQDLVEVDAGYEGAFAAALEGALEGIVVSTEGSGRAVLSRMATANLGGSVLLPGGAARASQAPAGAPLLRSRVRGTAHGVDAVLDALLSGVLVVPSGLAAACDLAVSSPGCVVVTPDGDRLGPSLWKVRDAAVVAGLLEAARRDETEAGAAVDRAAVARGAAAAAAAAAADEARAAAGHVAALEAEGRRLAGAADDAQRSLAELTAGEAVARADRERLEQVAATESGTLAVAEAELARLEAEMAAAKERVAAVSAVREQLEVRRRAVAALRRDLEVRAAGLEERRGMYIERRREIERRLAGREEQAAAAADRRRRLETTDAVLAALLGVVTAELEDLARHRERLGAARDRRLATSRELATLLETMRRERAEHERSLERLREQSRRLEIEAAEIRLRQEAAAEALRRDLEVEPDAAVGAPCPELPDGTSAAARARELERELRLLGPVNPLALEELAALEERHGFLSGQLEDVRGARRELARVIRAVDAEIVGVFEGAFADVARHFESIVATLFPGGSGALLLTDPADLLSTGVEIEARPAGRNVRRLSLLSGGERSLVALAFLFAVFRSRPSPFYLLDEVEAALDDVNLHRFLDLLAEFRDEAQLIVVSHQKRTMEIADVLYGVSMQPGGASKVVSERLRDEVRGA